jgi:hypothetical protein
VNELIEAVVSAHRDRDADGRITPSAAWMDLDADGRAEAFAATVEQRRLEAALDPGSLSTTARAVLARIR